MKPEIPVCQRCCRCVPLRRASLAWGYFKIKNTKLLRRYYLYSIAMLIMTAILITSSVCLAITKCITTDLDLTPLRYYCSWDILLVTCSIYFVILALQTYFLLLLRSEIMKQRSNSAFRFVNNAAEAECTITCEEAVVGEETQTEDV